MATLDLAGPHSGYFAHRSTESDLKTSLAPCAPAAPFAAACFMRLFLHRELHREDSGAHEGWHDSHGNDHQHLSHHYAPERSCVGDHDPTGILASERDRLACIYGMSFPRYMAETSVRPSTSLAQYCARFMDWSGDGTAVSSATPQRLMAEVGDESPAKQHTSAHFLEVGVNARRLQACIVGAMPVQQAYWAPAERQAFCAQFLDEAHFRWLNDTGRADAVRLCTHAICDYTFCTSHAACDAQARTHPDCARATALFEEVVF